MAVLVLDDVFEGLSEEHPRSPMHFTEPDPRVAALTVEVQARMPELIKNTVEQILEEMPVYRDEQFVPYRALHDSVVANLDFAIRTLRGSTVHDLAQASATGRARALQGAPLPELLRAFRI